MVEDLVFREMRVETRLLKCFLETDRQNLQLMIKRPWYGTFLQQLECGYEFPALIHVWIASAVVFRGERVQNPGFLLVLNFVYIFFWFLDLVALKQKYLNILPLKVIWSLSFWLKTEGFANIAFFWVIWENTIADLNFGLRVLE